MKKYINFLIVLLLPVFGFSQTVDLASWNLTANGNATPNQSYISATALTSTGLNQALGYDVTTGMSATGWCQGSTVHYSFFEISITPTSGIVNVAKLAFSQEVFGSQAPSSYTIKYAVTAAGAGIDDYQFFNTIATNLVSEPFANNGTKSLSINKNVAVGQKLTIRFYTSTGNCGNSSGWRIKPNTLKLTGNVLTPLAGTYYINSSLTPNFPTLTEAIRILNLIGVSAPVTFLLDQNTYSTSTGETFPLEIKKFAGTSETNTVTIKPNNKTVVIESNAGSVFKLTNAARNIIIDGNNTLTLYANSSTNEVKGTIMLSSNGTNRDVDGIYNSTFKNLILKQNFILDGQTYAGVYASGVSSKITIDNVILQDVTKGIVLEGASATGNLSNNWIINKISFTNSGGNKPHVGVYLNNAETYTISNNEIKGIYRISNGYESTHSGIIVTGLSNGSIFNNTIQDIYNSQSNNGYCAGIYIDSSNNLVYNNVISNVRSNQGNGDAAYNFTYRGHGIYHHSGANNKIYFNTVVMNSSETTNQRAAALFLEAGTAVTIKNNIFYNVQSVGVQYAIFSTMSAAQITSDYNDLVSPTIGYFNNADQQTLAQWKTATGKDANSLSIAPYFAGSQLRLDPNRQDNLLLVGQQGTPAVTADIDGEVRNTPTMGADELRACPIQGNQTDFGNNLWIGYVYSNYTDMATTPAAVTTNTNYRGFVTEPANFDRNVGTDVITGVNPQLCAAPSENFFVRYKMKTPTLAAGKYVITVGGDDGYRLYIDGAPQPVVNNWGQHNYTSTSITVTFAGADKHSFVLEYFDQPGTAHVSFTYGKVEGDPTVYGDNVWNVYAFNQEEIDLNPLTASYAGYYVDPAVSIDTENRWLNTLSPSAAVAVPATGALGWMGQPVRNDNFTMIHKRKGFPCGVYELKMDRFDDEVKVYLDDVLIYNRAGYGNFNQIIGTYKLNANSRIDVRFREGGSEAYVKLSITDKPAVYNNGWNGVDPTNAAIRIDSDFVFTGSLDVCSCTVSAGKKLTISTDAALNVENNVTVLGDGKILVKDSGSLVQIKPNAAFIGSTTSFTMERNSTSMIIYDYTYWSSPVQGQVLRTFSPNTLFDKFYSFNGTNWFVENREGAMTPGRGYIIRAPQAWNNTITNGGGNYAGETFAGGVFKGVFTGKANSGSISVPVLGSTSGGADLIGNPYPSPISASAFLAENTGKTDGNFYFWTHKTRISSTPVNGVYPYNDADYATLNKTGGTSTSPIEKKPSDNIAAGQGFFVNTTGTGNYVFTNTMRVKGGSNNLQFFRNANTNSTETEVQKNRYWLSIASSSGLYSEFLVGYMEGATNELDNSYDAVTYSYGNLMLYTVLDNQQMVIQGRQAPFANADVVAVGYKAATAGQYTISINKKEGLFENGQAIYLFDKTNNQYHDLTAGDFIFTTTAGTFEDRFEMRYTNETLGVNHPIASDSDVVVYKNGNQIAVKTKNFTVDSLQVYDITGKLLFTKKGINATEFSTAGLNDTTQVVVVKVILEEGQTISKKVMMN